MPVSDGPGCVLVEGFPDAPVLDARKNFATYVNGTGEVQMGGKPVTDCRGAK